MLNCDHCRGVECVKWNIQCVRQPCSRTPANACKSFQQPLPLTSDEVRSRSSTMWFEILHSLMVFLACRRLLAWRPTCDSQQQYNSLYSMFLLSQRLQWNFTHVTNAQQLALKIYQVKRINFSTSTLFTNFTSQWRHTDTVFRQVPRFLSISAWMQMLKIKLWRGY